MKKKKKSQSEINYWQSNTDMMTGLVLILLLIIMLLILYLAQMPENSLPDADSGNSYNLDSKLGDNTYVETDEDEGEIDNDGSTEGGGFAGEYDDIEEELEEQGEYEHTGGGGGSSGGTGIYEEEGEYEYPYPPTSGDEWGKAAVYVTVIDNETGRAIRKEGITFELYEEQKAGDGGTLRFLNTYYPEKQEYRYYLTTENGNFYLPEKVEQGNYYFKQITGLEGYDPAESVKFQVDDVYDWQDPYVVSIEISPSKNYIPIEVTDADTKEPVSDGTFNIQASEDILTLDGTLRYAENETADTVTINEEGYGQSQELYLGMYTVAQEKIPQYYASIENTSLAEVQKKDGSVPEALKFVCQKTQIQVSLADELYSNRRLDGAEFKLICENYQELNQQGITDENGELIFTDLEKNRTYKILQTSAPKGYRFEEKPVQITVGADGRIEGEAQITLEFTNYIPRVSINVKDKIFGRPVSDLSMTLYNSSDEAIRTWESSGTEEIFEDFPEGMYYVLLDGDKNKRYEFDFSGDEVLQEYSVMIWTTGNIIIILIGCSSVVFGISSVIVVLRKRVRKGNKQ